MARSYQWLRSATAGSLLSSGRMLFLGRGFVTGGGTKTFERAVFGFHITADDINGQPVYRGVVDLTVGLLLWGTTGNPDFDPANTPDGDWLWTGHMTLQPMAFYGYQADAIKVGWWTGPQQLETTTRRSWGAGATVKLGLITAPLGQFTDGSRPWSGSSYLSPLWSAPA